jgi:hypothetical protein
MPDRPLPADAIEPPGQCYGPYQPVDGPTPLHRYRRFKTITLQQRADRLEALNPLSARTLRKSEIPAHVHTRLKPVYHGGNWLPCHGLPLDGVKGQQRAYITWLVEQCTTAQAREAILTDSALTLLADCLTTQLQRCGGDTSAAGPPG